MEKTFPLCGSRGNAPTLGKYWKNVVGIVMVLELKRIGTIFLLVLNRRASVTCFVLKLSE